MLRLRAHHERVNLLKALPVLLALAASIGLWFAFGGLSGVGSGGPGAAGPKREERSSSESGTTLAAVESRSTRVEPKAASEPQPAWDGGLRIHFRVRAEDGEWNDAED